MRKLIASLSLLASLATPLAAQDCEKILSDYRFCSEDVWHRLKASTPDGVLVWNNGKAQGKLIIEVHTKASAPEIASVMSTIKSSVRDSLKNENLVTFQDQAEAESAKQSVGSLVYDMDFMDKSIRVHHSVLVTDQFLMQYLTMTSNKTDEISAQAHKDFLARFTYTDPEFAT